MNKTKLFKYVEQKTIYKCKAFIKLDEKVILSNFQVKITHNNKEIKTFDKRLEKNEKIK